MVILKSLRTEDEYGSYFMGFKNNMGEVKIQTQDKTEYVKCDKVTIDYSYEWSPIIDVDGEKFFPLSGEVFHHDVANSLVEIRKGGTNEERVRVSRTKDVLVEYRGEEI